MKKIIAIVLLMLSICCFFVACDDEQENVDVKDNITSTGLERVEWNNSWQDNWSWCE